MPFSSNERTAIEETLEAPTMHRVNFARMRGRMFDILVSAAVDSFLQGYESIMDGREITPLFDRLGPANAGNNLIEKAKQMGRERIYVDTKKVEIEIGCYATFDTLLLELCSAALNQAQVLSDKSGENALRWKSKHILRLLGDHAPSHENAPPGGWTEYQCLRRVIDFVAGMTDNYAIYVAKQLKGAGFSGGQRP